MLKRRPDGSQSIQPRADPGVPTQMYPNNDTLGERIELYVEENFPDRVKASRFIGSGRRSRGCRVLEAKQKSHAPSEPYRL